jgi:hypothetical protein
MSQKHCRHSRAAGADGPQHSRHRRFLPHAIVLGLLSLGWLILRTGRRPDRFAYPCQQTAFGNVSLLLGLPLAHFLRKALTGSSTPRRGLVAAALATVVVIAAMGLSDFAPADLLALTNRTADAPGASPRSLSPPVDYETTLYVVHGAGGPSGDHHLGVDELIATMARGGLPFYESATADGEAGPGGVVDADDVVLIKINEQWSERGGTNTDVLKGIIARILEHPDGFTGEVVVVENGQGSGDFDRLENNAEDHGQSPLDVVNHFAGLGHLVGAYLWDPIRAVSVTEYSEGDYTDGYVVGPYLEETHVRVSYPKFRTPGGSYVSLKHGIWDSVGETYDNENITFLNVPVLKCHGAVYGVTAATKHHVGTMTTTLSTSTHSGVRYGALGSFLADVRMADLNILDCIYILAQPSNGPWCAYGDATRVDKLVAGVDPVAMDMWATINILVPTILDNGYTSYPKQDPEDPSSVFRIYLDATMNALLAAGIDVTNDPAQIVALENDAVGADVTAAPASVAVAFPNPFRTRTAIRFDSARSGEARLDVYDVRGRLVSSSRANVAAGPNREMGWDGRSDDGRRLAAGTYYWRLGGPGETRSGKVTLLH